MEIIDNFLPYDIFKSIQSMFCRDDFPWYWGEEVLYESNRVEKYEVLCKSIENFQFYHPFYLKNEKLSNWNIKPIIEQLKVNALFKVKANLNIRTEKIIKHGYHIDTGGLECKTAIFYINSNDGFTEFVNGEKVESIENRVVIFDSTLYHTGTTCTNQKRRIVVNVNYF